MAHYNKNMAVAKLHISMGRLNRFLKLLEASEQFVPYEHDPIDHRVVLLSDWHLEQITIMMARHHEIVRLPPRTDLVPVATETASDIHEVSMTMPPDHRSWASFMVACGIHQRTGAALRDGYARSGNYVSADGVRCKWIIAASDEARFIRDHPHYFPSKEIDT